MEIKKIQDAEVAGKKIFLRADFNVAVEDGKVKEKFKITAVKKTLDYLLEKGAKVALVSHFGRPNGKSDKNFSLAQIINDVENVLGTRVIFVSDCIGETVKDNLDKLNMGEVLLLENVGFYEGEEKNEKEFAKKLAENFDIYINDAFSVSHRDQASVTGITEFLPSYAGFRLQKEIEEMEKLKNNFSSPAIAIIGGAKIETKLPVIKFFEEKYDHILVGGKIANEALDQKIEFSEKVILPTDFVDERLDIGPKTVEKFAEIIKSAKTIVWNGPMGKFEEEKYSKGTEAVLESIVASGAYVVIGGGETLEMLEKKGYFEKISFVSTGGGAMLEYLGGGKIPGIEALDVLNN